MGLGWSDRWGDCSGKAPQGVSGSRGGKHPTKLTRKSSSCTGVIAELKTLIPHSEQTRSITTWSCFTSVCPHSCAEGLVDAGMK